MRNLLRLPVLSLVAGAVLMSGTASAEGTTTTSKLEDFWYNAYEKASKLIEQHKDYEWARYDWKVLAKANPDECYVGIHNDSNYFVYPRDLTEQEITRCTNAGFKPKVNQAYVWGLAKSRGRAFFGTIANTHCLVQAGFYGAPDVFDPIETDSWVCEMVKEGVPYPLDARPPRIFVYDTMTNEQKELTSLVLADEEARVLLTQLVGLRSAGTLNISDVDDLRNRVVILGGVGGGGVNMFAFDTEPDAEGNFRFLGAKHFDDFDNIRQWISVRGQLYTGMAGEDGIGKILRWTPDFQSLEDLEDPEKIFMFETVGEVEGDPAYLAEHHGRLFASTWPPGGEAAVWMSPLKGDDMVLTPEDEFTDPEHPLRWTKVWSIWDYEVEPTAVKGGGAIKSFDGYLYWGTMDVPGTGVAYFSRTYDGEYGDDEPVGIETHLGTYRPVTIFRGKNFGMEDQEPVIELLYGSEYLPRFVDGFNGVDGDGHWEIVPNNMGQKPKFGLAGFGNYFNNYTWWMEVYDGNLFVGTMDHLYLLGVIFRDNVDVPSKISELAQHFYGADLWRFPSSDHPAIPVSISGVGNYSNYGVRTMVRGPDSLYLGMANPMNLLTDPNDDKPEGGWEFIKLWKRPDKDGDGIPDDDDACPNYANDDIGDPCCQDEDKDGVADLLDACPFDPNDAIGDGCNHDEDADGIGDGVDACPFDAVHDAIGDACNHDEDGDEILDGDDACPFDAVHDAIGDACNHDEDGDEILDGDDACPFDAVHDGFGDACNHDEDGDGVLDDDDACPDEAAATADGCGEEVTDDGSDDGKDDGKGAGGEPTPSKSETPEPGSPMGCSSTGSGPGAMLGLLLMGMLLWRPRRAR